MKTSVLRVVEPERDYTLDNPLPAALDDERFVLGNVLLDNAAMDQAVERLTAGSFYLPSHRRIFEQMLMLHEAGEPIDPLTLAEKLRQAGHLESVGGPAYIGSLFDGVPRFSNIGAYVSNIRQKDVLRQLIAMCNLGMARAFDPAEMPEGLVADLERQLLEISESSIGREFVPVGDVADRTISALEEAAGREQSVTGVSTGFHDLDYLTSGLQPTDLVIVAARPGVGKTAFGLGLAVNAARAVGETKPVVGVFSLEMSNEQLVSRLICSEARVDAHRLRSGYLSKDDWRRLAIAVGELGSMNLFLDDTSGISITEMRAKCRRLKRRHGRLDLVVVDYLQLVGINAGRLSRQEQVALISKSLKAMAKQLDVPVVALAQLSRASETRSGNHRPQLSDLRESGQIEADADLVLFIHRDELYKPDTDKQNIAEIIIGKHRSGPLGSVDLVFLKQMTRFENKYREPAKDMEVGDGAQ